MVVSESTIEKTYPYRNGEIAELIESKAGISLDIGCGANKQGPEWVGLDLRDLPGVDIVHDINLYPWPLPDECVLRSVCSHVVEHLPPHPPDPRLGNLVHLLCDRGVISYDDAQEWLGDWGDRTPRFIRFMNEVWRITKPGGQLAIIVPHGHSFGYLQDPSHCAAFSESVFAYFDPLEPTTQGHLWRIYKPKPWEITQLSWDPATQIEVLLRKRIDDYSYYE